MDAMLVILALFATIVQGDYSVKSSKGTKLKKARSPGNEVAINFVNSFVSAYLLYR